MKNKLFNVLILQIFVTFGLCAENKFMEKKFYNTDEYGFVRIFKNKLEFEDESEEGEFLLLNNYGLFKGAGSNYIVLHYMNENAEYITLVKNAASKFKYGYWEMTYSDTLTKKYESSKLVGFDVKKTDSYIVEKDSNGNNINFMPENTFNVISNPWAVSKNAKNKSIYLIDSRYCVPGSDYADIEEIIFINGFVAPDKPHLYEQNSRAKNVRITYDNVSFITTLDDSGDYQSVKLPAKIRRKSDCVIKIDILDSYEGSKYSDIVISGILYIDAVIN